MACRAERYETSVERVLWLPARVTETRVPERNTTEDHAEAAEIATSLAAFGVGPGANHISSQVQVSRGFRNRVMFRVMFG